MVEATLDAKLIEKLRQVIPSSAPNNHEVRFLTIRYTSNYAKRRVEVEQFFSWGFFDRLEYWWSWRRLKKNWQRLLLDSISTGPGCWEPSLRETKGWKARSIIFSFNLRYNVFPEVVMHPDHRVDEFVISHSVYTGRSALLFSEPKPLTQSA